jgi:hypothetical protein
MGIKFENILIWGRSTEEYIKMFGLTVEDVKLKIIVSDAPDAWLSV